MGFSKNSQKVAVEYPHNHPKILLKYSSNTPNMTSKFLPFTAFCKFWWLCTQRWQCGIQMWQFGQQKWQFGSKYSNRKNWAPDCEVWVTNCHGLSVPNYYLWTINFCIWALNGLLYVPNCHFWSFEYHIDIFSGLMRRINLNFWQTLVNGFITLKLICWRTTQVRGGLVKSAGLNRTLTDSSGRFKSGRNWWSPPYGEILARLIALGAKLSPVIAKLSLFWDRVVTIRFDIVIFGAIL